MIRSRTFRWLVSIVAMTVILLTASACRRVIPECPGALSWIRPVTGLADALPSPVPVKPNSSARPDRIIRQLTDALRLYVSGVEIQSDGAPFSNPVVTDKTVPGADADTSPAVPESLALLPDPALIVFQSDDVTASPRRLTTRADFDAWLKQPGIERIVTSFYKHRAAPIAPFLSDRAPRKPDTAPLPKILVAVKRDSESPDVLSAVIRTGTLLNPVYEEFRFIRIDNRFQCFDVRFMDSGRSLIDELAPEISDRLRTALRASPSDARSPVDHSKGSRSGNSKTAAGVFGPKTRAIREASQIVSGAERALRIGYTAGFERYMLRAMRREELAPAAHRVFSEYLLGQGDLSGARRCLEAVIRSRPWNIRARFALARILTMTGEFNAAAGQYHAVVELTGGDPFPSSLNAMCLGLAGDDAAAEAGFKRILTAYPSKRVPYVYLHRARFWAARGNTAGAIADLTAASAINRIDGDWLLGRWEFRSLRGNPDFQKIARDARFREAEKKLPTGR